MDSSYAVPKELRQGPRNTAKAIFRNLETHIGPGLTQNYKLEHLNIIHQAARDNDIPRIDQILQACPHKSHETDNRKCPPINSPPKHLYLRLQMYSLLH
jgi:hypothetical protein